MFAVLAHVRLVIDILTMKVFVWLLGRNGELLDSHLFFFDRYSELADYHRSQGHIAKAHKLAAVAEIYFKAAPDDDEPPAAAMAMPLPRAPINTTVVSTTRLENQRARRSNSAAGPADLVPSPAR